MDICIFLHVPACFSCISSFAARTCYLWNQMLKQASRAKVFNNRKVLLNSDRVVNYQFIAVCWRRLCIVRKWSQVSQWSPSSLSVKQVSDVFILLFNAVPFIKSLVFSLCGTMCCESTNTDYHYRHYSVVWFHCSKLKFRQDPGPIVKVIACCFAVDSSHVRSRWKARPELFKLMSLLQYKSSCSWLSFISTVISLCLSAAGWTKWPIKDF